MPGGNCAFPKCTTSEYKPKHDGVSLFNITRSTSEFKTKWRNDVINVIKRYRVITPEFNKLVMKGKKWICELHYLPEDIEISGKFSKLYN